MSAYERPINWNTSGKSKKDLRIAEVEKRVLDADQCISEQEVLIEQHKVLIDEQDKEVKRLQDAIIKFLSGCHPESLLSKALREVE